MTPTLWHIELSHYSEKARWALDHKGVEHRLRVPLVGFHQPLAMALTRSGHRRLPVLQIGGEAIGDSSAIIAALEERFPDPPLYPSDPAERDRALELERTFDDRLGPALRGFAWHHVLGERNGMGDSIAPTRPGLRRLLNTAQPAAALIIRRDYGATEEHAATHRAEILAMADLVERELGDRDHLVGNRFGVADLAAAALFTPVVQPPQRPYLPDTFPEAVGELRDELMERRAGRWVLDMYARYR